MIPTWFGCVILRLLIDSCPNLPIAKSQAMCVQDVLLFVLDRTGCFQLYHHDLGLSEGNLKDMGLCTPT